MKSVATIATAIAVMAIIGVSAGTASAATTYEQDWKQEVYKPSPGVHGGWAEQALGTGPYGK